MEVPKKKMQKLIFSDEFMQGVGKAIENAVAESDAAGLAPAYEPAFTKLREFRVDQKKSRDELIELRREARAEKAKKDHATLEFHRKVFDLLEEGGQPADFIMRKAQEMIELWENRGLNGMYGPMWRQLLNGSPMAARNFILSDDNSGWPLGLRSSSPFTHIAAYPDDEWGQAKAMLNE